MQRILLVFMLLIMSSSGAAASSKGDSLSIAAPSPFTHGVINKEEPCSFGSVGFNSSREFFSCGMDNRWKKGEADVLGGSMCGVYNSGLGRGGSKALCMGQVIVQGGGRSMRSNCPSGYILRGFGDGYFDDNQGYNGGYSGHVYYCSKN